MIDLQLMRFQNQLRVKNEAGKRYIFDPIRKKWLVLQPEELVRQLTIEYLIHERGYRRNQMSVEKGLKLNKMAKRYDLVVHDEWSKPMLLVECKSPEVPLKQDVMDQISWYNLVLKVKYLLVTNGLEAICCALNYQDQSFEFLSDVPFFDSKAN